MQKKINKFITKSTLILVVVLAIGILGSGIVYAYTHLLLKPWGSDYQSATFKVQNTFESLTKTQIQDAMIHWNGQLTKSYLFKSSIDTTETDPSKNGINTITKNNYGPGVLAENIPYYNFWQTYVIESDIRVNTYYPWANSVKPDYYDIQGVITHELGHVLRVGHSTDRDDVMYAETSTNENNRVVTSDDKAAARDSTARWFE